jgi:glucose/arabinose dehydrogenase
LRRRTLLRWLLPVLAGLALAAPTAAQALPNGFQDQEVFTGLTNPTAVRFVSDGRVFVAEKSGLIKVFDSLTDTTPTTFADLRTNVHNFWDRGLLGLALHPNFPTDPYVYVLYTYDAEPGGTAPRWGLPGATGDGCPTPPGPTGDGCVVTGRLSRLTASGNVATGPEQVLIEDWCQQYPSHSIGSLAFGADGALYVTGGDGASFNFVDYGQDGSPLNPCGDPPGRTGDVLSPPTAQGGALRSQDLRTSGDPVSLDGTVLRLNPLTGAAMPDNPLFSNSDPNARRIIARGLRNPFRMTIRPGTNEVWLGDVGWSSWEEINRVPNPTDVQPDPLDAVDNFGWPCYEGNGRQGGYDAANLNICENLYAAGSNAIRAPYHTYQHGATVVPGDTCPTNAGSSTSGLAFYTSGNYPGYAGALFFADYSRDCIWVMLRGADGLPDPSTRRAFHPTAANPVELQIGPAGDLFYPDFNGGQIRRIRFFSGNQPPTAVASAMPTSGAAPLTVNLSGLGSSDSDPGSTLTYAWEWDGDGLYDDSNAAQPMHTFTQSGTFTVGLRVTDPAGATDTDQITISVGNSPPNATIEAPTPGTTWKVGDVIDFEGSATDPEQGKLPATALSWELILHHCEEGGGCHTHPPEVFDHVDTGRFTTPDHEYPSHLELRLTATDAGGLTDTESLQLDPRTVELTLASNPAGLQLGMRDSSGTASFTRTVIVGSRVSVSAPSPQTLGGTAYAFSSWSDGLPQSHLVVAPEQDTTLTATFEQTSSLGDALLVVKDAGVLGAGDGAVKARLEALGYVVTVRSETATASDAAGKELVLISSTVSAAAVHSKFRDVAVPVIVWEASIFDDMGLTGPTSGTDFGEQTNRTSLGIGAPSHPLAAGLTGTRTVVSSPQTFKWGRPAAAAVQAANLGGDGTRATIFGYEAGAAMRTGTAPERRVGFFMHDLSANALTTDGWKLFEAAVSWADGIGLPPPPPPPPPTGSVLLVAGSTTLGAGDAAVKTRLEGLRYTVVVADDNVVTAADAAGKEVVLVSSSSSSSAIGTRLRDVGVPVIVWESALLDDMGLTGTVLNTDFGELAGKTTVTIAAPGDPLAAGLTGTPVIHSSAQTLKWGRPAAAAVRVATIAGDATRPTIFRYSAGATLASGSAAPARRVGFFLHDLSPTTLTANGWSLFDAAVTWADTG